MSETPALSEQLVLSVLNSLIFALKL